jgi:hypothetical protein
VLTRETLWVDFGQLREGPEAVLDLLFIPVLQREVHDRHEGKPSQDPEEPVGRLILPLQGDGEAIASDRTETPQLIPGLNGRSAKEHGSMGRRQQVDRHQESDLQEGSTDGRTDIVRMHRWLYERIKHVLAELWVPRRDPSLSMPRTALLPGETIRARTIEVPAGVLLLGRGERSVGGGADPPGDRGSRNGRGSRREEELRRRGQVEHSSRRRRSRREHRVREDELVLERR